MSNERPHAEPETTLRGRSPRELEEPLRRPARRALAPPETPDDRHPPLAFFALVPALAIVGIVLAAGTSTLGPASPLERHDPAEHREHARLDPERLRAVVDRFDRDGDPVAAAARAVYEERGYEPIWFPGERPSPAVLRLPAALNRCPLDAPLPADAAPAKLTRVARDLLATSARDDVPPPLPTLAYYEHAFTRAYLACLMGVAGDPESAAEAKRSGWEIERPPSADPAATMSRLLAGGLTGEDLARGLEESIPPHPQVERLTEAVTRYRAIVEAGGWPFVPQGETLAPGAAADRPRRLRSLEERLRVEGYLPAETELGERYAAPLVAAVESFQLHHGLTADGKLGPATIAALNVAADDRLRTLELNLERARWLPEPGRESREVWVNLPAARLTVLADGHAVGSMRVIAGKPSWQTPIFQDRIARVVVHPVWNVPSTIVADELLERFRADPGRMKDEGYRVFETWKAERELDPDDVDWSSVDPESIHVRQDPGPFNPLGRLKFVMPNDRSIYLHDTSARSLFSGEERMLSHGCVRVEKPVELATLLFPERAAEITAALREERRTELEVQRRPLVRLVYFTAWVEDDGRVGFYDDVYRRDDSLAERLEKRAKHDT